MQKEEIKTLLHHRDPYLLVDEVCEIAPLKIKTKKIHTGLEFYIHGHFPGAPVVPGAMQQEMCTQSAGILLTKFHCPVDNYHSEKTKGWAIGVLNKVESAKYLSIVKPEFDIDIEVELVEQQDNLFKFRAKVFQKGALKSKLRFNLMNISDSYLH